MSNFDDDDFAPVTGGSDLHRSYVRGDTCALQDLKLTSDIDRHELGITLRESEMSGSGLHWREQRLGFFFEGQCVLSRFGHPEAFGAVDFVRFNVPPKQSFGTRVGAEGLRTKSVGKIR